MATPAALPASGITPVLLLILDGVGCREAAPDNAISRAAKPHWDRLWREYAHTTLDASERHVGLPGGQMGNSEVGHLNIGAGRVIYQDLTRIDHAIETGEFQSNPALAGAVATARQNAATLHVLGLLSPGGVHSHERHLAAMVELAARAGVPVHVHAFLDGRDTPPRSAAASLAYMTQVCARQRDCRITDIVGRYYAMDRDKHWERVAAAYDLIVDGEAPYRAGDAQEALEAAYARGESDEFVKPTALLAADGRPARIADGDVVVFMNFRADRARQLTRALTDPAFSGFARKRAPRLGAFVCLTSYGAEFARLPAAFAPQSVSNGFGEYVAARGLKQLRIAETEKYAHVTYFFNGGVEATYPGEDRILVPSPRVATYDLKPEMSALEVTEKLVVAIAAAKYDAIVCNYANGDMVGHTGNLEAATRAVEVLDACIGRVVAAQLARGGEVLITADHGNVEMMHDPATGQPHTAHTLNLVPCLYVGRRAALRAGGALQDIAPTLLSVMGLPQPPEMTGRPLVSFA
ncbi:MAG TPA: 2,3-bisphosphoglycerate-independent phosphoglycerate mutase [Casimicrobiaceae bacterium]|nr:2,3-bisphosphoglycerate-independent phosphoglycerate mutase [Casimicrobiaceae bacterium]